MQGSAIGLLGMFVRFILLHVIFLIRDSRSLTTEAASEETQSRLDYFLKIVLTRGAVAIFVIMLLVAVALVVAKCFNKIHDRTELRDDDSDISDYTKDVLRKRMEAMFGGRKELTSGQRMALGRNAIRRWRETIEISRRSPNNSESGSADRRTPDGATLNVPESEDFVPIELKAPESEPVKPGLSSGLLLKVPRAPRAGVPTGPVSPPGDGRTSDLSDFSVEFPPRQPTGRKLDGDSKRTAGTRAFVVRSQVGLKRKSEEGHPSSSTPRAKTSVHRQRPLTAGKSRPLTAGKSRPITAGARKQTRSKPSA